MTVAVVTGGGCRTPTLAELEWAAEALNDRKVAIVRHRDIKPTINTAGQLVGSTDAIAAGWIRSRGLAKIEAWPADPKLGPDAGSIRNHAMLDGTRPQRLVNDPPADFMVRFEGGDGTRDCAIAAFGRAMHVHWIHARPEPRIWNSHHGVPPGPSVYCGRGSPVGNEWQIEPGENRATAAERVLGHYRDWLRAKISRKSQHYDQHVIDWIRALTPEHYIVCSCWPARCHAEFIVLAWRWLLKGTST